MCPVNKLCSESHTCIGNCRITNELWFACFQLAWHIKMTNRSYFQSCMHNSLSLHKCLMLTWLILCFHHTLHRYEKYHRYQNKTNEIIYIHYFADALIFRWGFKKRVTLCFIWGFLKHMCSSLQKPCALMFPLQNNSCNIYFLQGTILECLETYNNNKGNISLCLAGGVFSFICST